MFAHLTALFCLFAFTLSAAEPSPAPFQAAQVDVYLKAVGNSLPDIASASMTAELQSLMAPARVHVVIHGEGLSEPSVQTEYQKQIAIQVDMRGACQEPMAGQPAEATKTAVPLASTEVVNGRVLPFSWVDCAALNGLVAPGMENVNAAERSQAYGRAVARLLAHEFYHVLTRSEEHQQTGIAKPRFTAGDLLAEHFEFDTAAIAKLMPAQTPPPVGIETEPVGGR